MKILLLLANTDEASLNIIKGTIQNVLTELEVEIKIVQLERLPYFNGLTVNIMDDIAIDINNIDGVIAVSNVHLNGMHGAMQTFFDYLSLYNQVPQNKPLLIITYSNVWGETDGAYQISKAWRFLGGYEAGSLPLNSHVPQMELIGIVEKQLENFYRQVRQGSPGIMSSERMLFLSKVEQHQPVQQAPQMQQPAPQMGQQVPQIQQPTPQMGQPVQQAPQMQQPPVQASIPQPIGEQQPPMYFDSRQSYYSEPQSYMGGISPEDREIEEITNLLKGKMPSDGVAQAGTYQRPLQSGVKSTPTRPLRRIASLPHYFVARHDRTLDLMIQYIVNDTKEQGYVTIRNGECDYVEGVIDHYTIEVTLVDAVLEELLTKEISYQKAFMVGKIKVKGNFAVLPKLDQVFRSSIS
ncbi:MAG: hypothetical protein ATN35_04535 [Epulopiscium sp. Nele67-Bin004]|nr:MAG: hypothetical protein ATN35_04535 [Epulopiscium sp. Nele67-Bin004]